MSARASGWLAFLRIYLGLLWLNYGTSKFEPKWAAPNGEFLSAVQSCLAGASAPVHAFLVDIVIPHQATFAHLIAYGETLVGISLVLGVLTRVGALGGVFLALTYYVTTGQYKSRLGVESLELLLVVTCLLIFVLPAARAFSIDAWIGGRRAKRGGPATTVSGTK